ncbi:MAG: C25 family cysteine peptidase [Candidatus Delongbacteria bacterium]
MKRFPGKPGAASCLRSLLLTILCLGLSRTLAAAAPRWQLLDPVPTAAPALELRLLGQDEQGLELELTLHWLELAERDGGVELILPGEALAGLPGEPALPAVSRLLATPGDAAARLEILELETVRRRDLRPAPRLSSGSDRPDSPSPPMLPLTPTDGTGGTAPWAGLGESALWQGVRVLGLDIFPVRWDRERGELEALRRLRLRITWERGARPLPALRSAGGEGRRLVRSGVLNADSPWLDRPERIAEPALPGSYLVLSSDAALPGLADWIRWKREMGHELRVISEGELDGPGTSYTRLRQAVQEEFDANPFDYLLLVGDVDRYPSGSEVDYNLDAGFIGGGSYSESQWGSRCGTSYCIVSDHLFSLLEGDDYFADVLVGRFSVDTANDLAKMVRRSVDYEAAPFTGLGTQWFGTGLMIYDVAQAPSRREVKLAIRDLLMQEAGYARVDTIHNHYWQNPVNPAVVTQRINSGLSLINYRGFGFRHQWYGPLFGVDQMDDLTNVGRWPYVTSIVCGGGDFASVDDDPCLGEGFLRAGTQQEPTGAIGFVGPSEEDTHTEWNNCIDEGIYFGLAREGLRTLGALMDRGKLELWGAYPNARNWGATGYNVPFYFHCYNLLGDPGLELRTRAPRELSCVTPASLPVGLELLELQVAALDGQPLAGLRGCLYHAETDRALTALADESGRLRFSGAGLEAGAWTLTLSGPDLLPLRREIPAGAADSDLRLSAWSLTGAEPEDGLARPGETLSLQLELQEQGLTGAPAGRLLTLEAPPETVELLSDSLWLEASAPGQSLAVPGLSLRLGHLLPYGEPLSLNLRLDGALLAILSVEVAQPGFLVVESAGDGHDLVPGYQGALRLRLLALGLPAGDSLRIRLGSLHDQVRVTQAENSLVHIEPDSSRWLEDLRIRVEPELLPGSVVPFELGIWAAADDPHLNAPLALLHVQLPIGAAGPLDPLGPDAGGYLAWHSGDEGAQAPLHEWVSIAATGQEVELVDWYDPWGEIIDGASQVLDLPFPFRYYGQDYLQVTVCSNGWLAFGDHHNHWTAINTPIPAAQGPAAMVAAYWTDLVNSSNGNPPYGHLYTEGRPAEGLFLVEWNHFRPAGGSSNVDVQLILRDPALWPTPTGDGELLLHFHDMAANNGDNGVTVGLENPQESGGLQYVCNNSYAPAAQPLTDGCSLLFTPLASQTAVAEPSVRPAARLDVHPNPFNPATRLRLELPEAARVRWSLVNLLGQTVLQEPWRAVSAGAFSASVDGGALASGVYLLRVEWRAQSGPAGGALSEKILLLR